MLNSTLFLRSTSANRSYIKAADGIRFLAIFLVVTGHVAVYLNIKAVKPYSYTTTQTIIGNMLTQMGFGLQIFFVLSGFLLVIPLAQHYANGYPKPSILQYYLRRLVRLELPYLLVLTCSSIVLVFVIHKYSFSYLLPRYIASVFYSNHLIYGLHPEPLPIAWSLEAEIQFYITVPLWALLFRLNAYVRVMLLSIVIIVVPIMLANYPQYGYVYFVSTCPYFFAGMLVAHFYILPTVRVITSCYANGIAVALLLVMVYIFPYCNVSNSYVPMVFP